MKRLKLMIFFGGLFFVGMQISCNEPLIRSISDEELLVLDIEDIENYLSENGYTDYDTLISEIRAVIIEEGDGDPIEYLDVIEFDFIGRYTSGLIFDTTIAELAFKQDTAHADTIMFDFDTDKNLVLDQNGLPEIDYIEFEDGYRAAYRTTRLYEPSVTTHTQGGWFVRSESATIPAFNLGVHYVLERANYNGRGMVLLPSAVGSSQFGLGDVVTTFEIRPLNKR